MSSVLQVPLSSFLTVVFLKSHIYLRGNVYASFIIFRWIFRVRKTFKTSDVIRAMDAWTYLFFGQQSASTTMAHIFRSSVWRSVARLETSAWLSGHYVVLAQKFLGYSGLCHRHDKKKKQ